MKGLFKKFFLKIVNKKKNNNFDFAKTQSVLINGGAGIGDGLVITSAFNQLKKAFPNIKLGIFTSKRNEWILKNSPLNLVCIKGLLDCLKNRKKWQVVINLDPTYTTKRLIEYFLLSPQYIISFPKIYKKYYNQDTIITDLYIDKFCKLADILSLTPFKYFVKDIPANYIMPPLPNEKEKEVLPLWNRKIKILICPKGTDRKIDPKVLLQALKSLSKDKLKNCQFILPHTEDIEEYSDLKNIENCYITFAPPLDMLAFFALVKSADIVISVDSAPVHLAFAYQKYLIGLFLNYNLGYASFEPEINEKTTIIKTKKEVLKIKHFFEDFDTAAITKALEKYITLTEKNIDE